MTSGMKYKAIFIIAIIIFAVLLIIPTIGNKKMEITLTPQASPQDVDVIEQRFKSDEYTLDKKETSITVEGIAINDAVMNEVRIFSGVKDAKILPHWAERAILAKKVNLGLDLQGGMHLVMMADFKKIEKMRSRELSEPEKDEIAKQAIGKIEASLDKKLNENEKKVVTGQINKIIDKSFEIGEKAADKKIKEIDRNKIVEEPFKIIDKVLKKALSEDDKNEIAGLAIEDVGKKLVEKLSDAEKSEITQQALELLRNRIDKFGVSEPSIRPRGNEAIEIQLPGVKDPESVKKAIGTTGRVEYRLVKNEFTNKANDWLGKNFKKGKSLPAESEKLLDLLSKISSGIKLPRNFELLFLYKRVAETKKLLPSSVVALESEVALAGNDISKAWVGRDEFGSFSVHFKTTPDGAAKFASVTSEKNKGQRLAIIIDEKVRSMPSIKEQITSGNASITGDFTMEEVNALARIIKEGALPVNLKTIEERTVGPSLGQEAIDLGINAILVGFAGVIIFMMIYYKMAGMISVVGLILNMVFMLALLSWLGFTVTLPGLAGVILTVGMAVDANVIIYERIKEEIKTGKSVRMAVTNGFDRAFWTIFDANITTLIAAFVLSQYGTGAVKGFAVTLFVGIVSSMFVALYITRFVYEIISQNKNIKKLSI